MELVRRSLLQGEGLPFADALTAEQMQQAFDEEGVSFGRDDHAANVASANASARAASADDDGSVSTSAILLWAMLSQSLFTDVQRSCRAAVQRVAVYYALVGREVSSTNTGAYCRARAKVTAGVVRRLTAGVAVRDGRSRPRVCRFKTCPESLDCRGC